MTEENKKLIPLIWDEIGKANSILLHCHPDPDPDSIGTSLAFMHMLQGQGKKVTLIKGDSDLPRSLSHLPGYDHILLQNYFEIDLSRFDLFIILDSGSKTQISKKGDIVFPENLKTIVLDHHASNDGYGSINLIDASYPATAQIVFDLFQTWKIKITPQIAECLMLGIYSDTGGFKYSGTTSHTFDAASQLASIYPQYTKSIYLFENNLEPQHITFISLALAHIENYFENKVRIAAISYAVLKDHSIEKRHADKMELANTLKAVVGTEIGISFIETEPNIISVSMRSRNPDKYDVSKIAVATKVGGGHRAAAGARVAMPFEEAKTFLLETIQQVYPELGDM